MINIYNAVKLSNIQINGKMVKDIYTLLPNGQIYNSYTKSVITGGKKHSFELESIDEKKISISQKKLYRLIYNSEYYEDDIQSLRNEKWFISPIDDRYQYSNYGRLKDCHQYKARIILNKPSKKGYVKFKVNRKGWTIHRFIYFSYHYDEYRELIENNIDIEKLQIHHKDGCKLNNSPNNLILCYDNKSHTIIHKINKLIDEKKIIMLG